MKNTSKNASEDPELYHQKGPGKIELGLLREIKTQQDLSLAYTPGVGEISSTIAKNPDRVWDLTSRGNWVAVVTDGSAVLGLGNIGPQAALPVMEGKAVLFKTFAGVDAFPICLNTQDADEIVAIVKALEPSFAGINLEDISAPRCFEIETRLREEMNIPVFHDDQHGTAIVVLAGLINALKLTGRTFKQTSIAISGAGAAGVAIAKILLAQGAKDIVVLDSKGIISKNRNNLNESKTELAQITNSGGIDGNLASAIKGRDVFIGVSAPGIATKEMVASMNKDAIVFALSNPDPEIMPQQAVAGGAAIVATGRSDFPNQVNNVLAFPGVFRGALDAKAKDITKEMKLAAAHALADFVKTPTPEKILPAPLDPGVATAVSEAVKQAA